MLISSRRDMLASVIEEPNKYNVIAILESYLDDSSVKSILENAKDYIILKFDDIEFPRDGYVTCTEKDIEKAINFAEGKDDLIVACAAGVSRSSAMAYLIECTKTSPRKATEIWKSKHHPNPLIIDVGSKFLNNDSVKLEYKKFLQNRF